MKDFLNSLKGFRTLIVQTVLALIGVLVAVGVIPASEAAGYTTETVGQNFDLILGGAITLVSAIGVLMRLVTKTPVGQKSPEAPKVTG